MRRAELERTGRPHRFAYADPPYPGKAGYYPERREVDHAELVERLVDEYPDGWALSTSAGALAGVLRLCPPDVRVCIWVKAPRPTKSRRALNSWEPLVVRHGRPLAVNVVQDLRDVLWAAGRHHSHPGALVGMKPPAFCEWMFEQLGARRGDELDDLFPGSGAVTRAWRLYAGGDVVRDASLGDEHDASRGPERAESGGAIGRGGLAEGASAALRGSFSSARSPSDPYRATAADASLVDLGDEAVTSPRDPRDGSRLQELDGSRVDRAYASEAAA